MLELVEITRHFGPVIALDRLSLRVERNRVHGFVGRNGAGKTTTMRIALGLLAADGGEVRIDGRPLTGPDRRRIGYMPEERGLYPKMSAREQLVFFAELSGLAPADAAGQVDRVLAALGVAERADEHVEKLSLGNQQRVQLAVALVVRPELLILDEPFSGLDPVGVDALAGVLQAEVDRGAAVIFSSHQLDLVERLCDEVTIIEAGRVVAAGTIDALRAGDGRERLRVSLDTELGPAWVEGLAGARLVAVDGDEFVVELLPGGDDQVVLDAARAAGRVRSFRREEPRLVDLFREVVGR